MCGIAGIYKSTGGTPLTAVKKMCAAIKHRGPDDEGFYSEGNFAMGMQRLSIIDVSSGHQPIFNEDKTLVIVFNGEIYNFQSLRKELDAKGHVFKTQSDTEVILHLYEEEGTACVKHLQGMFAFAIWDLPNKRLFIARDRFGIKPLYYYWDERKLIFSSEIKALLTVEEIPRNIDLPAVDEFFTFLFFPGENTPFIGLKKLLPGHALVLENKSLSVFRYYSLLDLGSRVDSQKSESDWLAEFNKTFANIVEKHLISDVPLGAFLSGGVDSSLLVGVMREFAEKPVQTFSVGYDDTGAAFDEREYALKVSKIFGTNHHEFIITPEHVRDRLPEMLNCMDEPFADASVVPSYCLSEYTRQFVTVALTGLGGDEICGGYERYLGMLLSERLSVFSPLFANKFVSGLVELLPDSSTGVNFPERLKRFVRFAGLSSGKRYYNFIANFNDKEREQLFLPEIVKKIKSTKGDNAFFRYWHEAEAVVSGLRKLSWVDFETYLADNLLLLSDRTSMASSLEIRVPFVDHKLVELFWRMPDSLKIKGFSKKYFLKKALEKYLPKELIYRKKKGFSVPFAVWFRGALKDFVEETLSEKSLTEVGVFNPKSVRETLDEHYSKKRNNDEKILALLSFVHWYRSVPLVKF